MKKRGSYILLTFMFMCLSFCFFSIVKVSALENNDFWSMVGGYSVVEVDVGDDYSFYADYDSEEIKANDKEYNYDFHYDYTIKTNKPLIDGNNRVFDFYGMEYDLHVRYVDLSNLWNPIADEIKIYRYNFISQEFEIIHAPGKDKEGSYLLTPQSSAQVYKIVVTGIGAEQPTYVVVDNNIANAFIDDVVVEQEEMRVTIDSTLLAPYSILDYDCRISLSVDGTVIYNDDIENVSNSTIIKSIDLQLIDLQTGEYNLKIVFIPSEPLDEVSDAQIELKVDIVGRGGITVYKDDVTYDFKSPILSDESFYHPELMIDEFKISGQVLPSKWAFKFGVRDTNNIASVSANFESVSCTYDGENAICLGDSSIDANNEGVNIVITVVDSLGNESSLGASVSFDNEYVDSVTLENIVVIDELGVSLSNGEGISKLCIFYGNDLEDIYECVLTDSLQSSYYYSGPITIVALDETGNVALLKKEVEFTKGYDASESQKEVTGIDNELLSEAYLSLFPIASNPREANLYVKYGELVEEYTGEDEIALSYLDVLNDKFQDRTCAFNKCDKVVEAYITFEVAGVMQSISAQYLLKDTLPSIIDFISTEDINLEYKNFDINSLDVKTKLYAYGYLVNLLDEEGNEYSGRVTSSFIKFIDNNGVVELLDNETYDYIASANKLGTYVLECKVQIQQNITTNHEYTDYYGKSFFLNVNLVDTTLPTITLVGETNVNLKQHDVYKDSGAKCEDDTECTISINYYLNGEIVDSLNTSVEGTYTIEYVAVDEGGNIAKTTRTVVVANINSLDTTSIIIIVSLVVSFIIFITIGIIIEKKKSRKTSREE